MNRLQLVLKAICIFSFVIFYGCIPESIKIADSSAEDDCYTATPLEVSLVVTDASQNKCYNSAGSEITCPVSGDYFGQDAQYSRLSPSYSSCSNVITDNRTGLMWEKTHHNTRISYSDAESYCSGLDLGGYTDWRIPSIKELFSISTADGNQHATNEFYLDSNYFDLAYPTDLILSGSHTAQMMGQTWSSTSRPDDSRINYFFNFLDGHIKSNFNNNSSATMFYRCTRGDATVFNDRNFTDNSDQTVTDNYTGLTWQKANGEQSAGDYQFDWKEALSYCENLTLGGTSNWRLPDIKELQSIIYYDNPNYATERVVIDLSVFEFDLPAGKNLDDNPTTSPPNGDSIAPYFWSSTTHGDANGFASYMCFGPCWAVEQFGGTSSYDAHGPGAQRSDPKDEPVSWPTSIGDQKDVVQVYNFVRCVKD